jgi:hypothetical protein
MARGVHMMKRYKFERHDNSSKSFEDHHHDHPDHNTSPTMKSMRLVDFDFLQELYDKAPPLDYKQKLRKVIDTSIEDNSAHDSFWPRRGKKVENPNKLEESSYVGTIGDEKRKDQVRVEPNPYVPHLNALGKVKTCLNPTNHITSTRYYASL